MCQPHHATAQLSTYPFDELLAVIADHYDTKA
jgi:hypothetical protein